MQVAGLMIPAKLPRRRLVQLQQNLAPFIAKVFTAFEKVKLWRPLAFSEASRRGELEINGGSTCAMTAKNLLDRPSLAVV
jgi:hypothetical protein